MATRADCLAAELIATLDGEAGPGVNGAWLTEVDRRIDQVRRGQVKLTDRESVSAEIREALAYLSLVSRRTDGSRAKATRR
jgi:hypothetical protein